MKKFPFLLFALLLAWSLQAQQKPTLTVEKIMQDPKWMGSQPSNIEWSENSQKIYFDWNPSQAEADSVYEISPTGINPTKLSPAQRRALPPSNGQYSKDKSKKLYTQNGDLYLLEIASGKTKRITNTFESISNAKFAQDENKIIFQKSNNLFSIHLQTGEMVQLTNFKTGQDRDGKSANPSEQEQWLKDQQLDLFDVLKDNKRKRELREQVRKADEEKRLKGISLGSKSINNLRISADERFVSYMLFQSPGAKNTDVPNYVTESGYTENISARSNVGSPQWNSELWIYDRQKDSTYQVSHKSIPGIKDLPDYLKDYPQRKIDSTKVRPVSFHGPVWSESGQNALLEVRSQDYKDRWIMLLDAANNELTLLDRQRDEAWISGPGISWAGSGTLGWMPDQQHVWFQSEASGYSHLYQVNVKTQTKTALTSGKFEVFQPFISRDKKSWYFTSSEEHPGVRHFYKMPLNGGKAQKLTSMKGNNEVSLSPDEKWLAIRYSYSNKPWQLYVQANKAGASARQVTNNLSEEFKAYPWREPEMITFKASDGVEVHARLYQPQNKKPAGPAVIFVHGAGYLQNVHYWWSSYSREYMFHNLLVDLGYTVLDIDYRASSGYGRDFRTGIYRHMGGKDLSDQVDGAKLLVDHYGVDAGKIGIYGGSYGGFITLMALFTQPDIFKSGAALRSVTDWAHYNHGYTANILNTPVEDSIAYARSSPIYFADGLKNRLLICHGMVDTNVHFQDVVRLSQRLIELGKDNWEMAVYPVEDHGFVQPSSWTDEYKRILKLFEETLK